MSEITVNVSAKSNCVVDGSGAATGINVEPGDKLIFTASRSDTWTLSGGARASTADGAAGDFGNFNWNNQVFPYGALVGSLDNGASFFMIGTYREMVITANGSLLLYCWDSIGIDNGGTISVRIEHRSPP